MNAGPNWPHLPAIFGDELYQFAARSCVKSFAWDEFRWQRTNLSGRVKLDEAGRITFALEIGSARYITTGEAGGSIPNAIRKIQLHFQHFPSNFDSFHKPERRKDVFSHRKDWFSHFAGASTPKNSLLPFCASRSIERAEEGLAPSLSSRLTFTAGQ